MTADSDTATALRRQDDRLLSDVDKRLALVEQARQMDSSTRDAHFKALENSISALSSKVDSALTIMQTQSAEPSASPAGRLLAKQIAELQTTVDGHDDFVQQMTGALRLARFALGTSFLSVAGNIILAIVMASGSGQ